MNLREFVISADTRYHLIVCQDREGPRVGEMEGELEMCDAEILDELTTSRGELKLRSVSVREERHGLVIKLYPRIILLLLLEFRNVHVERARH